MYNKENKRIIAMGRIGFHYTSSIDERKSEILEDAELALSVLEYNTKQQLATMYDRYEEHKAQQLIESCNAYLYIAKTNPGKSGNRSRKWLAEHYDQVPAYLKDEIERIDTDARIYNLYMATLGWEI